MRDVWSTAIHSYLISSSHIFMVSAPAFAAHLWELHPGGLERLPLSNPPPGLADRDKGQRLPLLSILNMAKLWLQTPPAYPLNCHHGPTNDPTLHRGVVLLQCGKVCQDRMRALCIPLRAPFRTAYTPVVHCGSVRQAAHVIQMMEMRSANGSAITHEHGVSLAPAVAAAAALLCTTASGAARIHPPNKQQQTCPVCCCKGPCAAVQRMIPSVHERPVPAEPCVS